MEMEELRVTLFLRTSRELGVYRSVGLHHV